MSTPTFNARDALRVRPTRAMGRMKPTYVRPVRPMPRMRRVPRAPNRGASR